MYIFLHFTFFIKDVCFSTLRFLHQRFIFFTLHFKCLSAPLDQSCFDDILTEDVYFSTLHFLHLKLLRTSLDQSWFEDILTKDVFFYTLLSSPKMYVFVHFIKLDQTWFKDILTEDVYFSHFTSFTKDVYFSTLHFLRKGLFQICDVLAL